MFTHLLLPKEARVAQFATTFSSICTFSNIQQC